MIESKREVRVKGILDIDESGNSFITTFVEREGFTSEDTYNLNDILKDFDQKRVSIRIESINKGDFKIEQ